MRTTVDPSASRGGEVFGRILSGVAGGKNRMGTYNRAGQFEVFDKTQYGRWMKGNHPEPGESQPHGQHQETD